MRKILLAIILLSGLSVFTAQAQMSVGPGLEIALPIGDFSSVANLGIGATGQFQYNINESMAVTGTTGYIHFLTDVDGVSFGMIPIQVGFKYYFSGGLYGMGQLGLHMARSSYSYLGTSYSDTSNEFSFGVGAGYELALSKMKLDLAGRFQLINDANYLGVRAGLVFPIGGK
jgi:opacity protein-like surface antigen